MKKYLDSIHNHYLKDRQVYYLLSSTDHKMYGKKGRVTIKKRENIRGGIPKVSPPSYFLFKNPLAPGFHHHTSYSTNIS